jgi:predicted outer membrane protein
LRFARLRCLNSPNSEHSRFFESFDEDALADPRILGSRGLCPAGKVHMWRYFRWLAFFYIVYCAVALTPKATSAAGLVPEVVAPAASVQTSDSSSFPELERRAAAQEGLSDQDKGFLMAAVQAEMLQRELSRVAIARARNAAVRHFAEATGEFMGKTESQLNDIAKEFGMSLPRIAPDKVEIAKVALGKSKDSNREYLTRILADTKTESHLYKDESVKGQNPVIVQYAREMFPRLSQHYRNAARLWATMRSPAAEARQLRTPLASRS